MHGLVRRASMFNRSRIDHLRSVHHNHQDKLQLHYGELNDLSSLRRLLNKIHPTEVYHLGGQSHVGGDGSEGDLGGGRGNDRHGRKRGLGLSLPIHPAARGL